MSSFSTRSIERDSLFIMAELRFQGVEQPLRVTVRNLSARGMMVEREHRVKRGARVVAELRSIGQVAGVVVWARSPLFGIAFEHEIDPLGARRRIKGGSGDAPAYTRSALPSPRTESWSGQLRRI